ncbi:MAG: hypothetical protein E7126_00665 [Rikenellaceae bacterium]|nr:hypothetical protein [Rikenellaceae bacterium]
MKLLTNIIGEYLKHNKRLVVPKLGTFIVKAQGGAILFSDLMRNDDGVLRSLLMAYGMKELEANGLIDRLVFEVRHATSRGESYTIEGLGDFTQGPNNTLTFRQKREKVVIGGNIKPPVETLVDEQRKIERVRQRREAESAPVQRKKQKELKEQKRESRRSAKVEEDDDIISMTKPDSYLRGLKYDQKKNKKRDEDFMIPETQRHSGRNMLFMLVAAIIVGIAVWFVWQYLNSNYTLTINSNNEPTVAEAVELRDSTALVEPRDTVASDSVTLVNPSL